MCGRYRLSRRKQIIEEHFDAISGEEDWNPRYNIAPTQPVAVIRQRNLTAFVCGTRLIPAASTTVFLLCFGRTIFLTPSQTVFRHVSTLVHSRCQSSAAPFATLLEALRRENPVRSNAAANAEATPKQDICVIAIRSVYPDWKASHERYLRSLTNVEKDRLFVAEENGSAVGFIDYDLSPDGQSGKIGLNAVHPTHQRKGVATLMYEYVLDMMKRAGAKYAQVGTGGDTSHAPANVLMRNPDSFLFR
jgi:GNAT superfamily N-acetyltransferase